MTNLKFRIYDIQQKKMIYLTLEEVWNDGYNDGSLLLENEDIMLYIGMKDKNGREIYERDIVKSIKNGKIEQIAEVKSYGILEWRWGKFGTLGIALSLYEGEVIGNIYENPELIKEN